MLTAADLLSGSEQTHSIEIPAHMVSEDAGAQRSVELRPLVLADVARLNKAARDDGELSSALMIQQAMIDPKLTLDQVHGLSAGLVEFLVGEINQVSGLSLDGDDLSQLIQEPLSRAVFVLSTEFGWTPDRCADLTVGQVLLYLEMLARGERP